MVGVKFTFTSEDQIRGIEHLIRDEAIRLSTAISPKVFKDGERAPYPAIDSTINTAQADALMDIGLLGALILKEVEKKRGGNPISRTHPLQVEVSHDDFPAGDITKSLIAGLRATAVKPSTDRHFNAPPGFVRGQAEPIPVDTTGNDRFAFGMHPDHMEMNLKKLQGNMVGLLVETLAAPGATDYVLKEAKIERPATPGRPG